MSALLAALLDPAGQPVEMDLQSERCAGCFGLLTEGGAVAGLLGDDKDGLPGFALMHEVCLSDRVLRAI